MNLNKTFGRVATTLVAATMLASLAAPVYADPAEPTVVDGITITKIVTTDGNTYAPATNFTFTVENGAAADDFNDGINTVDVTAGVTGGLTGTTIASAPDTEKSTATSYTFTGKLAVDVSKFEEPGVYHYVVKETAGNYEGITYSADEYDVYVYVVNGTSDYEIAAVIAFKDGVKTDISFTNDYGATNDTTHDVIVTKNVEGSLANMSDTFTFTVGVNGAEDEVYKVVYTNDGEAQDATFVTSGTTITVEGIGDEDTIHIYGLSANDTYTVTETDGASQGYTVSDSDSTTDAGTVSGKVTADGTAATITNTKNATTPTGIVMDIAPYVLLVVVAAAGCFVFLRKRRED